MQPKSRLCKNNWRTFNSHTFPWPAMQCTRDLKKLHQRYESYFICTPHTAKLQWMRTMRRGILIKFHFFFFTMTTHWPKKPRNHTLRCTSVNTCPSECDSVVYFRLLGVTERMWGTHFINFDINNEIFKIYSSCDYY